MPRELISHVRDSNVHNRKWWNYFLRCKFGCCNSKTLSLWEVLIYERIELQGWVWPQINDFWLTFLALMKSDLTGDVLVVVLVLRFNGCVLIGWMCDLLMLGQQTILPSFTSHLNLNLKKKTNSNFISMISAKITVLFSFSRL